MAKIIKQQGLGALIIIIIVCGVFVAGGLVYYFRIHRTEPEPVQPTQPVVSVPSGNPTSSASSGTVVLPGPLKTVGMVPLVDMQPTDRYLGQFQGGLYENGSNVMPQDHAVDGAKAAASVQTLDKNGNPSASGKIVMLSIGMSNWTMEFCSGKAVEPCDSFTFMGAAAASEAVNHSTLVIKNGALGGRVAKTWVCVTGSPCNQDPDNEYDRVRDSVLAPAGLSEKQVEIIAIEDADPKPTVSLPSQDADAYVYEKYLGQIVRAAKVRYPNLKEIFLQTRTYSGFATSILNPEPYAYEYGYATKWLIQAQITQMRSGKIDPTGGDLSYAKGIAPWITWGAYYWANGATPCIHCATPNLTWAIDDFSAADRTHPAPSARQKVADALMAFFTTTPYAPWFKAK